MNLLFYGIEWHWKAHGRNRKFCRRNFSGKLPALMVIPFANVLPFGEVTAGALILFGLFTRAGLVLSGLLLVGLTFGTVMLGDAPTVAHNAVRVRKFLGCYGSSSSITIHWTRSLDGRRRQVSQAEASCNSI
jgi:hypothetical protein